jgi:hypothetical protein
MNPLSCVGRGSSGGPGAALIFGASRHLRYRGVWLRGVMAPSMVALALLAVGSAMHLCAPAAAAVPSRPSLDTSKPTGQSARLVDRTAVGNLSDPATALVLEDFTDIVTAADFGFNDLSGNTGSLNKDDRPYGRAVLRVSQTGPPVLRFEWDFGIDTDRTAFTGLFHSLFGLTDTRVTFDGTNVVPISFPEHSLDLDRIDGILAEPGGPRSLRNLHIALTYTGPEPLTLRLELKDVDGGVRFQRFVVPGSPGRQVVSWDFRNSFRLPDSLDIHSAKVLGLVVEREHVGDRVRNPERGSVEIERIWFDLDRPERAPVGRQALLSLLERRSCQHFVDWTSRKEDSFGLPMDRSTFADLLTVGGVGFALPAAIICAERGWITRAEALERVDPVLRLLADANRMGPERVGRTGYRGFFYHFLGPDGRRKLNFDFEDTERNERLNTVELSTIDTGLALMGVLAAQSYFIGADPREVEVRKLAQDIYDAVDWSFMLERSTNQFYLGWKPNEEREPEPPFEIPDAFGTGKYSGKTGDPATLDFYTDEALIVILMAVGSKTDGVPPDVYCALAQDRDERGLVRSYPGSLFTYQFLHAFLDARRLAFPGCAGEQPVDWYKNSRKAIRTVIKHAEANPDGLPTYGPHAWGISAAEGPDDRYRAYGAPPVAVNPSPEQDGTVTYYAMASALGFGEELRARAIRALRRAWDRGHWHPRFALPDAFHDAIEHANLSPERPLLRSEGSWLQRARFAIDEGPMLLHLENARSGLIWNLLGSNPNIQRALDRLRPTLAPTLTDNRP